MGICFCDNRPSEEMTMITFDDLEHCRTRLYNCYKLNPFHSFTAKMQTMLLKEFSKKSSEKESNLEKLILKHRSFEPYHYNLIIYAIRLIKNSYLIKHHSEKLLLNLFMFMLSNTKNNNESKLEVAKTIIAECEDKSKKVDLEMLKSTIVQLIKICLNIMKYCVFLPVFIEGEDNLTKFLEFKYDGHLEDEAYNRTKVPELVFHHIAKLLRRDYTYQRLIEKWENFVLAPYIYASYSNAININKYNLELKEELLRRVLYLFDGKLVIDTFLNMDITEYSHELQ